MKLYSSSVLLSVNLDFEGLVLKCLYPAHAFIDFVETWWLLNKWHQLQNIKLELDCSKFEVAAPIHLVVRFFLNTVYIHLVYDTRTSTNFC